MKKLILLSIIIILGSSSNGSAQEVISASIYDIIKSAQAESPDYLLAKTSRENQKWRYTAFKSVFKPQIGFEAILPNINRSVSQINLPGGAQFVNNSFMTNSVGVNLNQVIGATGGSVFISSNLQRLDQFAQDTIDARSSYLSNPIRIGFVQPLFQLNPYKWDKKEAELNYALSKKVYVEEREQIAFDVVNNFFDLYTTKLSLIEARNNRDYLDSLAVNSEGRFSVGRISETDLLQIQLSAKNADGTVARLELGVQNKTEILRDFLGLTNEVEFDFSPPEPITLYDIDKNKALEYAQKNRSQTEQFRLALLNAERQVEEAQRNNGPNISLSGSFGLTKNANTIDGAYSNLLDQEGVSLSINIPIVDFGRRKAQREIAKSNLEITRLQVRQNEVSFERDILVNVEQFGLKRSQLKLAEEALVIALKRLDIAKKRFQIGKIDVTNLNIAIQEEQGARQQYFNTLWDLWRAHYTIRNLTLFDFETNTPLD
ncbi:MAG: outer membrane protein [Saprospiraceae bacterium]|jgi:outer membrane protein TolC